MNIFAENLNHIIETENKKLVYLNNKFTYVLFEILQHFNTIFIS